MLLVIPMNKVYLCIDLKSFYASVECTERNLNPLTTNLVVADSSRTEKTICLAVTPPLKQYGLSGRSRLYEVVQRVREINYQRKRNNNYRPFRDKSYDIDKLNIDKSLELDFIIAKPRMNLYIEYSTKIYDIYLKYLSKEDIHVYSIDEVFMDITNYLDYYKLSEEELATKIILDIYKTTGITATCGIGTNMYLAKVAMDILAKHEKPNKEGVRIASLDEITYRERLWNHTPLTDFWRVGKGINNKLNKNNIYTMGDLALYSLANEDKLYKLFGINAELLIDHAWGYEPCTMKDIKSYKPDNNSLSSGQVLHTPYDYNKTKLVVKEMTEELVLDIVSKHLLTNQIVLTISYDIENLNNNYNGEIAKDYYGRYTPKPSHGTIKLDNYTSSSKVILSSINKLYTKIVNPNLLIRRINIAFINLITEEENSNTINYTQLDLFSNNNIDNKQEEKEDKKIQETILSIKSKYGKNSILKGSNLLEDSTAIERNKMIGGHNE